jgi:hypothetical protein
MPEVEDADRLPMSLGGVAFSSPFRLVMRPAAVMAVHGFIEERQVTLAQISEAAASVLDAGLHDNTSNLTTLTSADFFQTNDSASEACPGHALR